MNNVVTFPACLWDGSMWWHAGKSYVHLGKLKELCTTAEWRRIYEYDIRRHLREPLCESRGGNAA